MLRAWCDAEAEPGWQHHDEVAAITRLSAVTTHMAYSGEHGSQIGVQTWRSSRLRAALDQATDTGDDGAAL